jgi:hypothetical protein
LQAPDGIAKSKHRHRTPRIDETDDWAD